MKKTDHFEQAMRLFAQLSFLQAFPPSSYSDVEKKCATVAEKAKAELEKQGSREMEGLKKQDGASETAFVPAGNRDRFGSQEERQGQTDWSPLDTRILTSDTKTKPSGMRLYYVSDLDELHLVNSELGEVAKKFVDFETMRECLFIEIGGKKAFKFGEMERLDDYIMLNCFMSFFISNGVLENKKQFNIVMKSLARFEIEGHPGFAQINAPSCVTSKEGFSRSFQKLKAATKDVSSSGLSASLPRFLAQIREDESLMYFLVYCCKLLVKDFVEGLKQAGRSSYHKKYYITKPVLFKEGQLEEKDKDSYKYFRFCLEAYYLAVDSFCELIYIRKTDEDYHYKNISINRPKSSFDRHRSLFYILEKKDSLSIFTIFNSKTTSSPWNSHTEANMVNLANSPKKTAQSGPETPLDLITGVQLEKPSDALGRTSTNESQPPSNAAQQAPRYLRKSPQENTASPTYPEKQPLKLNTDKSKRNSAQGNNGSGGLENDSPLPIPGHVRKDSSHSPFLPNQPATANLAGSPTSPTEINPNSSPQVASSLSSRQKPKSIYKTEDLSAQPRENGEVFKFRDQGNIYRAPLYQTNTDASPANPSQEPLSMKLQLVGTRNSAESFSFFDQDALLQGLASTLEVFDSTTDKIGLLRNTDKSLVRKKEDYQSYGASYRGRSFGKNPTHTASKILRMAGKSQDINANGRFASRTSGGIVRGAQISTLPESLSRGGTHLIFKGEHSGGLYNNWDSHRFDSGTPSGANRLGPSYNTGNSYRYLNNYQDDFTRK